jgi:hypothetical protein
VYTPCTVALSGSSVVDPLGSENSEIGLFKRPFRDDNQ